jgi:HK97 family phage major capsid protein
MNVTKAMREFAQKTLGLKEDATDDQVKAALGQAMLEGKIDAAKLAELQGAKPPDVKGYIEGGFKGLQDGFKSLQDILTAGFAKITPQAAVTEQKPPPAPDQKPPAPPEAKAVTDVLVSLGLVKQDGEKITPTGWLANKASEGAVGDPVRIRLKSPVERYSQAKSEARWPSTCKHVDLRNVRVTEPGEGPPGSGRPLDMPSQAEKAILGAYVKWCGNKSWSGGDMPAKLRLTQHDEDLLNYAIHELPWTGYVGGDEFTGTEVRHEKLAEVFHKRVDGIKALLDDSTSGGIQAAPVVIEDQLIIAPLLTGELFPYVTVRTLTRGRRIHAATMSRPTITSGTPEGTAIGLFDTTAFIGTFDMNVYTAVGAMEVGLDFEEDSPADIGGEVTALYGDAAKAWLDMVIALGDGTTQPLGILNTPALVSVGSANGPGGPLTVADAEGLMFGLTKAYRTARNGKNVFVGNDVSYRRFRNVPLGSAWANSRAMGSDYGSYEVLGYPFAVIPDAPNTWISFFNPAYYRMYRRLGFTLRTVTDGKTLALANTKLLIMRMRWSGQLEQGGAAAVISDAPS